MFQGCKCGISLRVEVSVIPYIYGVTKAPTVCSIAGFPHLAIILRLFCVRSSLAHVPQTLYVLPLGIGDLIKRL